MDKENKIEIIKIILEKTTEFEDFSNKFYKLLDLNSEIPVFDYVADIAYKTIPKILNSNDYSASDKISDIIYDCLSQNKDLKETINLLKEYMED